MVALPMPRPNGPPEADVYKRQDHYGSLAEIEDTFCAFMRLVDEDGAVIVCGEDPRLVELARSTGRSVFTYGEGEGFDAVCTPRASSHTFGTEDVYKRQSSRFPMPVARMPRSCVTGILLCACTARKPPSCAWTSSISQAPITR